MGREARPRRILDSTIFSFKHSSSEHAGSTDAVDRVLADACCCCVLWRACIRDRLLFCTKQAQYDPGSSLVVVVGRNTNTTSGRYLVSSEYPPEAEMRAPIRRMPHAASEGIALLALVKAILDANQVRLQPCPAQHYWRIHSS